VAAITRTSTVRVTSSPTRSYSPPCSTRDSFGCSSIGRSPIPSRKIVPPSVNRFREQLLPYTGFSPYEHGRFSKRDRLDLLHDLPQRWAGPDDAARRDGRVSGPKLTAESYRGMIGNQGHAHRCPR
jgi:hypothetical protein